MRALLATVLTSATLATWMAGTAGVRAEAASATPSADAIFSAAKSAWRSRREAPFIAYDLRERYQWRGRTHDNWWQVSYRDADRALALHRRIVMDDERERLKGMSIGIHVKFHATKANADSFDTNANADAFPLLDPYIEPNASFGLLRREPKMGRAPRRPRAPVTTARATAPEGDAASPFAAPSPVSSGASPNASADGSTFAVGVPTEKPLREVAHVEAVARDYQIALAGSERVRGSDTYHLALTPLRNPRVFRLRDLWIDRANYATVQLAVQGIFEGKPYADARWTVGFVTLDGRTYVQQIRTDDPLRFGLDRVVTGLEFDFVGYAFPQTISDMTFARLL
ncbi:MAG: hypothetical protein NVSMB21_15910 [Vulcanimicrobiaceae bacterium]